MQMIVVRNLPHVVVEKPAARVLGISDTPQRFLHRRTFVVAWSGAVLT
jgi:hypothetical protein